MNSFFQNAENNILYVLAGVLVITLPAILMRRLGPIFTAWLRSMRNISLVAAENLTLRQQNQGLHMEANDARQRAESWQESSQQKDELIDDLRTRMEAISEECHQILDRLEQFQKESQAKDVTIRSQSGDIAALKLYVSQLIEHLHSIGMEPQGPAPTLSTE